jgi:mRNA interferase HigB
MHVITQRRLRDFWRVHPLAENPLRAWLRRVRTADWKKFADVRADYPSADQVGKFTVFDIGGNKFRLIVAIHFNRGKVFIRHVLTHAEYKRGEWKND